MDHILSELSIKDQQELQDIFSGRALPPLYSDVIAKSVFNADVHPERLNYLLRSIARDDTIDVVQSAANENFRRSLYAKGMISDIPAWLRDQRLADLEMQKVKQDFIFTRAELYTSQMLLLQYSVVEGQAKGDLDYTNVKGALLIVLMVESPAAFLEFDETSDRYIHRFTHMTSDTGLTYPTRSKVMYVQLDKCLEQFKRGYNAESDDGKPDRLQLWLSMIANVNDEKVSSEAVGDETLDKIRVEAFNMAQDKEVQNMLMNERFERMDWISYGNERERQGEARGISTGKILGFVEAMRDDGKSDKDIIERLMAKYSLSREQAEGYVSTSVLA